MVTFSLPINGISYVVSALVISAGIRLLLSFLRWTEGCAKPELRPAFWGLVWGFKAGEKENDYLQPFIVGLLELLVYPALLAAGKPEYVGAWLGFKVVPRLGAWSTHRETYQRFLIGNALVVVASYFLQKCFYA
jgi:hypothetical protein